MELPATLQSMLLAAKQQAKRAYRYRYHSKPLSMQLEVTNRCNYQCVMCPAHKKNVVSRSEGFLEWNLFEKICHEIEGIGGCYVIPQGAGETFLHPRIMDMLERLMSIPNVQVGFNTNGSVLSEEMVLKLISLGINDLGFSIDALDRNEYKRISGFDNLPLIEETIEYLVEQRTRMKRTSPRLRILLVDMGQPSEILDQFIRKWLELADEVIIQIQRTDDGRTVRTPYVPFLKRQPCMHLWNSVFIQWNGDMVICCEDWKSELVLGNVAEQDFMSLWQSGMMQSIRQSHLEKRWSFAPICASCQGWIDHRVRVIETSSMRAHINPLVKRYMKRE